MKGCVRVQKVFSHLTFLVADTRLYTLPCQLVSWSVGPSHFWIPSGFCITAPVQPSATGFGLVSCWLKLNVNENDLASALKPLGLQLGFSEDDCAKLLLPTLRKILEHLRKSTENRMQWSNNFVVENILVRQNQLKTKRRDSRILYICNFDAKWFDAKGTANIGIGDNPWLKIHRWGMWRW